MKNNNRTIRTLMGKGFSGAIFCLCLFMFPVLGRAAMSVVESVHNLSAAGPGSIRAVTEGEVCVFCHTPHRAESVGILWNRKDPTQVYTTYQSTTVTTTIGQPTGASRMCLSCHDGTIALGEVSSRAVEIQMTQQFLDTGPAALRTDLSDDHPVSFVYDSTLAAANPEYRDPSLYPDEIILDRNNELQCTSCHDAHDNSRGKFMRADNVFSTLCLYCHQKTGWPASSHSLSTATWNGTPPDPWPHTGWITVNNNACENCHRPHTAGGSVRLLNEPNEEDNCFPCHNGNVASADIQSEFSKVSVHPITDTAGIHDPKEDYLAVSRHVECVDCHNPHQVNHTASSPSQVSGRLAGVTGVSASGTPVASASYEYEICFKCHADSAQGAAPIPRQILELNKRLQFDLNNPSYHPVGGPGENPNVPSLLPAYNTASVIYCTDCHNNDAGAGTGGAGPAGPHGSQWNYLLERRYETADNTPESPDFYALCYKCHNRNSILSDQSFKEHNKHIVGENAPCSICHDPHGISSNQGNTVNNSHLINFDLSVVSPVGMNSQPIFEDQGTFKGRCYLMCHGKRHNPKSY
ncbi:MAG: cytochrome c3 family protein [bacterium]